MKLNLIAIFEFFDNLLAFVPNEIIFQCQFKSFLHLSEIFGAYARKSIESNNNIFYFDFIMTCS